MGGAISGAISGVMDGMGGVAVIRTDIVLLNIVTEARDEGVNTFML
jgi:hypothetical protein